MSRSPEWRRIRSMVTDDSYRVVSFDLFRTVLDRPCGVGALLRLLSAESDMDLSEFTQRRNACGGWWASRDTDSHVLKQREMAMESRLIHMRQSIVDLAVAAHESGKTVIVITDNYIPSELLTKALGTTMFPFDRLYSSADTGRTKAEGSLFDAVLEDLRVRMPDLRPEQVLHIGDNIVSDVRNAEARGMHALFYPAASDLFGCSFLSDVFRPVTVGDELLVGYAAGKVFDDPFVDGSVLPRCVPELKGLLMFPLVFISCSELAGCDREKMAGMFSDLRSRLPEIRQAQIRHIVGGDTVLNLLDDISANDSALDAASVLCRGFLELVGRDLPYLRFSPDMFVRALCDINDRLCIRQ